MERTHPLQIIVPPVTTVTIIIPRIHVLAVISRIITRQTTRITLLQDSQQAVRIATVKRHGRLPTLTMMTCFSRYIAASIKKNGISVQIVISIRAITPYSVVRFAIPTRRRITITRECRATLIQALHVYPVTRMEVIDYCQILI